jgi:hypothetical protein
MASIVMVGEVGARGSTSGSTGSATECSSRRRSSSTASCSAWSVPDRSRAHRATSPVAVLDRFAPADP